LAAAAGALAVAAGLVWVGVAMAPVRTPADPPKDQLEEMRKELAAGRPYTAIPARGEPAYSRWLLGAAKFAPSDAGDGACALNTPFLGSRDLAPAPMAGGCVVRGEGPHAGAGAPSHAMVGVYIGYHEAPGAFALIRLGYTDFEIPPILGQEVP